jgi:hypothetical protein
METKSVWFTRVKVLCVSAILASIANFIFTTKSGSPVSPLESAPGLLMMFAIVVVGCLIQEGFKKYLKVDLPTIVYISLLATVCSIPGFMPFAEYMVAEFGKMGLLPLCTPILAYAGISTGKDVDEFKKQGVAIICVSLLTFLGTYLGSAIIAQVVLKMTGVI